MVGLVVSVFLLLGLPFDRDDGVRVPCDDKVSQSAVLAQEYRTNDGKTDDGDAGDDHRSATKSVLISSTGSGLWSRRGRLLR